MAVQLIVSGIFAVQTFKEMDIMTYLPPQNEQDSNNQEQSGTTPQRYSTSAGYQSYEQPYVGQPPYGEQYYQAPNAGQQAYGQQSYAQYQNPYQYQQPYYDDRKSKIAAGLFGIFLGVFGVHNFYLGRTGVAVAQLLISILSFGLLAWVSAIWGLIEGILILAGSGNYRYDGRGMPLRD